MASARHSRRRRNAPAACPATVVVIRHGGRPVATCADGTVVSVAELLRREGRGPRSRPGALQPRGRLRPDEVAALSVPLPRLPLHKAAATATALFAVGVLVGPVVVPDASVPLPGIALPDSGADGPTGPSGSAVAAGRPGAAFLPAAVVVGSAFERTPEYGSEPSGRRFGPTAGVGPVRDPSAPGSSTVPGAEPGGGGAAPGGEVPGGGDPGGGPPGGGDPGGGPGGGGPGTPGPGPDGPGTPTDPTTPPGAGPDPSTDPAPLITVPPVTVLPGIPVTTPGITVGELDVRPPTVAVTASEDGVGVATGPVGATSPDVRTSSSSVGPVTIGPGGATLPDVDVSGAGVAVTGEGPSVHLPEVTVSRTEIDTPDLDVGGVEVPLPDVTLPEISVPQVSIGADEDREPDADSDSGAESGSGSDSDSDSGEHDTVGWAVDTVGETVGGLLGGR